MFLTKESNVHSRYVIKGSLGQARSVLEDVVVSKGYVIFERKKKKGNGESAVALSRHDVCTVVLTATYVFTMTTTSDESLVSFEGGTLSREKSE